MLINLAIVLDFEQGSNLIYMVSKQRNKSEIISTLIQKCNFDLLHGCTEYSSNTLSTDETSWTYWTTK